MAQLKEYLQATELTSLYLFCVFLFNPVLAPYVKSLGLNDLQVSFMFALFPLTLIFMSTILGTLSDAIGRKKLIIFGIIAQVLALVVYMLGNPWLVFVARFMEALAFAGVVMVGMARIQDSIESKSRSRMSGVALTLMQVGKLIAPVIGGYVADFWFIKAPFIFSMFALMIMLWIVAIGETLNIDHHFTKADFNILRTLHRFLSDERLKGMGVLGMTMHFANPILLVFIPIFIVESFQLSFRYVGYAIFAMQFFMLFQFVIGVTLERFRKDRMILLGVIIFAAALILLAFMPGYWYFIACLLLLSLGGSIWNVSAWSFMSDIGAEKKSSGNVIGSYFSVVKVGAFLGFIVGGLVVQYLDIHMLMIGSGILIFFGATAFYILEGRPNAAR